MALPANLATRRVAGRWLRFDGKPDQGTVTLTPSVSHLYDAAADVVVTRVPITIPLDKDGRITGKDGAEGWPVPVTDDPDLEPVFTYELRVKLKSGYEVTKDIAVPAATEPLDLLSVVPVAPVEEVTGLVEESTRNDPGGFAGLDNSGLVLDSVIPAGIARDTELDALTYLDVGAAPTFTVDPAVADGATDNTAAIQAELDSANAAGGGVVRIPKGGAGSYILSGPIVVYSNTVLDARNATLVLPSGVVMNMLQNRAVVDTTVRDSKITVLGGTWRREDGSRDGTPSSHSLRFRRCDGLTIREVAYQSPNLGGTGENGSGYGINPGDCTDVLVDVVNLDQCRGFADGVYIQGPANNCVIRNVSGDNESDSTGILAGGLHDQYGDVVGDVTNVLIENVYRSVASTESLFAAYGGDPDANGNPYRADGITARNLRQSDPSHPVVSVAANAGTGVGDFGSISVDGVDGVIQCDIGGSVASLAISHWFYGGSSGGLVIDSDVDIGTLAVEYASNDPSVATTDTKMVEVPVSTASVDQLLLSKCHWAAPTSALSISGTVKTVQVSDYQSTSPDVRASGLVYLVDGATVDVVQFTNVDLDNFYALIEVHTSAPCSVYLSNASNRTAYIMAAFDGSDVVVRGFGVAPAPTWSTLNISAQATVHCHSPEFRVDVDTLTPAANDLAFNNNGDLACGVGPVGYDGASWIHLITGATYTPA